MEFRFDVNQIFNQPIVRINSNLLPTGFRGDRRAALDTATKMAEIINEMGQASAKAQGLNIPVTTAQKLRMSSDQYIYLLGDPSQGRNGSVVGLLKVGKKSLYVFDPNGQTQMVNAPCVLDFYVHESRQRSGLGKDLFQTMLREEQYVPEKMAVDRPSDKLLGFLRKHYGLQKTIPQMNNFVVYDGFFESGKHENNVNSHDNRMHITASPNTALFGPQFINDEQSKRSKSQQQSPSATSIPLIQNSPVGRYAAPRPMCSMAECLSSANVDQNVHKPNPSNTSVHPTVASNIAVNKPNPNASINSRPAPSDHSLNRYSPSNANIIKPAPPNGSLNMERAGLPSQIYNQSDMQVNQYEAPASTVYIPVELNPAEPVGKPISPDQEIKNLFSHAYAIPVENSGEVHQEVCPKCSAIFPSSRSSAVKVGQSEASLLSHATAVNNQTNDAIIHSTATTATGEPNSGFPDGTTLVSEPYHAVDNEFDTVNINFENLQVNEQEYDYKHEVPKHHDDISNGHNYDEPTKNDHPDADENEPVHEDLIEPQHIKKPTFFPLSKQHTGLKNISYNVGIAVSPTNKMDFDQKQPAESFTISKINRPIEDKAAGLPSHDNNDTASVASSAGSGGDGFTDQGYYDLKFYHNKLW